MKALGSGPYATFEECNAVLASRKEEAERQRPKIDGPGMYVTKCYQQTGNPDDLMEIIGQSTRQTARDGKPLWVGLNGDGDLSTYKDNGELWNGMGGDDIVCRFDPTLPTLRAD